MLTRNKFINYNLRLKNTEKLNMVFSGLKLINKKAEQKKEFLSCLIANLIISKKSGIELMVSRAKNYYASIPPRYKRDIQNYQTSIEILDKMEKTGYMVRQIGVMGQKPDTYVGTDKLFKILNDSAEVEECIQAVNIILRKNDNGKKSDIDYIATASTIKLNDEVKLINDVRTKNKVSLKNLPAGLVKNETVLYFAENTKGQSGLMDVDFRTSYLVRIFNNDFKHGGRFYRGVESNMPKKIRKYFAINGNETVELDYKALHLNMLYHNVRG